MTSPTRPRYDKWLPNCSRKVLFLQVYLNTCLLLVHVCGETTWTLMRLAVDSWYEEVFSEGLKGIFGELIWPSSHVCLINHTFPSIHPSMTKTFHLFIYVQKALFNFFFCTKNWQITLRFLEMPAAKLPFKWPLWPLQDDICLDQSYQTEKTQYNWYHVKTDKNYH